MLRKIQETNKVKVFCRSSYSSKLVNEKGLKNMSGMSLSSVTQSCLTLCIPMDCRTPGFSVLYQCPELAQTYVHQVGDPIQPSHPVVPFSSCLQSFLASGSFLMSQLFTSGGQSIVASGSASVLPMNIQDWFPLGLTGLISLQSKGLSRVFSNTTVQKHQKHSSEVWAYF